ncbi:hypothetical protein CFD26_108679 [Aspergillus turcosus]|uniref:DUF7707 domain-containing protein n=1 Tax=Aspergillus turcosus TaxID=1245748 RepID=A0A3R7FC32_9EURO|nr:hypothetical protein CFD26_108679 [Aspergillus turcosus]
MIFSRALIVAASMAGLVSSQTWTAVNISAIDPATRSKWCLDQTSSCPLLCYQMSNATGNPIQNSCDPTSFICGQNTLTYQCICSNNIAPNSSEYSQTIPYYLCTEANTECVARCPSSDSACQSACRSDHPCGAQDPKRYNVTTTTSATSNPTNNAATTTTLPPFTGEPTSKNAAVRVSSVDIGHVAELAVHLRFGRYTLSRPSLMTLSSLISPFYPVPSSQGSSLPLSLPVTSSLSPIHFFLEEHVYPEKTISATSFFLSIATYLDEVVLAGCPGEVIADELQGPFCQLCLQRGHSLIRCPLREGLMFLGHVSMMLQLPNEAERSSTPSANTNNGQDWRRRRRWLNASRRMRERITRRRGNTCPVYATSTSPEYTCNQYGGKRIRQSGWLILIVNPLFYLVREAPGTIDNNADFFHSSSTSSSTTADENLTTPRSARRLFLCLLHKLIWKFISGNQSFRSDPAESSQAPSNGLTLRLSNEARPGNSNNGGLVNENILAEIASMEHPETGYVSHWESTAQVDTVMTGAVGAVVGDHGDGIFDLI